MTILVINNKGQYNHRIQRSLQYLNIPSKLVSNDLSIEEIEAENPIGLILGGGPSLEGAGMSEEYKTLRHSNFGNMSWSPIDCKSIWRRC